MNLLAKASAFEKLCNNLVKRSQIDPNKPFVFKQPTPQASLSGPVPHYSVSTRVGTEHWENPIVQNLANFAIDLMQFDLTKHPGMSVDVNAVHAAGNALYGAFKAFQKDAKKFPELLKSLETVVSITRDGGGELNSKARNLYDNLKKLTSTFMPKPKPKAKTTPQWLQQYMTQENAAEEAQNQIDSMQQRLNEGPAESIQQALNRQTEPLI